MLLNATGKDSNLILEYGKGLEVTFFIIFFNMLATASIILWFVLILSFWTPILGFCGGNTPILLASKSF
jgi:hypothetical protein